MIGFEDPYDVQVPAIDVDILSAYHRAQRNGLIVALAMPTARAQRATNQTITDATDTGIAADVLTYDSHGIHSVVGGVSRFTVPDGADGEWDVGLGTHWQANNNGERKAWIRWTHSGVTKVIASDTRPCGWNGDCEQSVSTSWPAVGGDYFEFFVWHNAGSVAGTTTPGVTLDLQPWDYSAQVIRARWVRLPQTIAAA